MPEEKPQESQLEPVTLKIDGLELQLLYDYNLIAEAEEETGCNLLNALESLGKMNAKQLRGLLYAAIVSKPRPTVQEVGKMIRLDTMGVITAKLSAAYMQTIKKPSAPVKKEPAKAKRAHS